MKVKSIRHKPYRGRVYDLEVEGVHAYFANGLLVKNCHCSLDIDRQELRGRNPDDINVTNGKETMSLTEASGRTPEKKDVGAAAEAAREVSEQATAPDIESTVSPEEIA